MGRPEIYFHFLHLAPTPLTYKTTKKTENLLPMFFLFSLFLFSLLTPAPLTHSLLDGNEAQKAKKCEKVLPKKCAKHYGAGRDLFSLFTHAPLTYSLPDGKKRQKSLLPKTCAKQHVGQVEIYFKFLHITPTPLLY